MKRCNCGRSIARCGCDTDRVNGRGDKPVHWQKYCTAKRWDRDQGTAKRMCGEIRDPCLTPARPIPAWLTTGACPRGFHSFADQSFCRDKPVHWQKHCTAKRWGRDQGTGKRMCGASRWLKEPADLPVRNGMGTQAKHRRWAWRFWRRRVCVGCDGVGVGVSRVCCAACS